MTTVIFWLLATIGYATLICIAAKKLGYHVIIGGFIGCLILAITIAGKLGVVPFIENYALSASIFVYSATFIFTDVLSEVYGKKIASKTVYIGAILYPLIFLTLYFSVAWEPHEIWSANQESFAAVFGTTLRVVLASFVAFVASQLHDIWAFHFWKKRTNGKMLWVRNNLSTLTSQIIDTVCFYSIAFYGVFPIGKLILATLIVKLVFAIIDTPIVYLIVNYLNSSDNEFSK